MWAKGQSLRMFETKEMKKKKAYLCLREVGKAEYIKLHIEAFRNGSLY